MSPDYDSEKAISIIAAEKEKPGALLPILHSLQDTFGYVPPETIELIADALNLSRADIFGVITFYHDFLTEPPSKRMIRICGAEACQSMGSLEIGRRAREWSNRQPPGEVTLKPVYCLGLCALAPAAMIGNVMHARLTPEKFERLLNGSRG